VLSVIVPCYNHGATLRRALDSIVVSTQSLQASLQNPTPQPTAAARETVKQLVPMLGGVVMSS
jgi:hypothetical protein